MMLQCPDSFFGCLFRSLLLDGPAFASGGFDGYDFFVFLFGSCVPSPLSPACTYVPFGFEEVLLFSDVLSSMFSLKLF